MRKRTRRYMPHAAHGMRGGILLFVLFFASFVLLVVSRLEGDGLRTLRGQAADFAAPVLEKASLPGVYLRQVRERVSDYFLAAGELERLRGENEELRQWRWRAEQLDRRLAQMRSLLHAVEEQALKYTTGRVIADTRGPFVRSILINAGGLEGVKAGYAVVNGDGLAGRTIQVGDHATRAILLNDLNSRTPVLVGPSAIRAVLAGDNSAEPLLEFVPDGSSVFVGDEIITSGDEGLLPRGLRVGVISSVSGSTARVRTHATLSQLDYVSILFFDSPLVVASEGAAGSKAVTSQAQQPVEQARIASKHEPAGSKPRGQADTRPR
ncbi:MAG: rod shape-determining protein MreC [Pseudomonadota bacterium]|nr:rod shape-determining protein MreC [Pseudomonadota bacterium]